MSRRSPQDSQEALARAEREARAEPGNLSKVKRLVHLSLRHNWEHRGRSLEAWESIARRWPEDLSAEERDGLVELDLRAVPALIVCLGHWRSALRMRALSIIEDIGDGAEAAIPAITRCLEKEPSEQTRAARALAGYGARASSVLPELGAALERCDASARRWVLRALGRIGAPAAGYADAIIAQLASESDAVREEALEALSGLGLSQDRVFKALLDRLDDRSTEVRSQAIKALGRLDRLRVKLLPRLLDLVLNDSSRAAAEAARVLGNSYDEAHIIAEQAAALLLDRERALPPAFFQALGACEPEDLPLDALLARLPKESEDNRAAIARLLGRINPDPARAVPALAALYADSPLSESGIAAVVALGEFGEDAASATETITRFYEIETSRSQVKILKALGWIGHPGNGVLELLIKESDNVEGEVRAAAIEALTFLGSAAVPAIDAAFETQIFKQDLLKGIRDIGEDAAPLTPRILPLLEATTLNAEDLANLDSAPDVPDWDMRRAAIRALRSIGPGAAQALPALQALAEEKQGALRASALLALGDIDAEGATLSVMQAALSAESERARSAACLALSAQGARAESATEDLVKALGDESKRVRAKAAEALGEIGAGAARAIPALLSAMAGEARGARGDYVAALSELIKDASGVAALRRELMNQDDDLRRCAADALGWAGKTAAAAAPELVALLEDFSPQVRAAAADALGCIENGNPEVIEGLARVLGDGEAKVRRAAAMALSCLGEAAGAAEDALINALSNTDEDLRSAAAEALGSIRARSARAYDALARALADPTTGVRYEAADALKTLRPPAREVEDAVLAAIAEEEAPDMVVIFLQALAALRGGSDKVALTFERAQNDPRREVREAGRELAAALASEGQGGGDLEAEGAEDDVAEVVEDEVADGA